MRSILGSQRYRLLTASEIENPITRLCIQQPQNGSGILGRVDKRRIASICLGIVGSVVALRRHLGSLL